MDKGQPVRDTNRATPIRVSLGAYERALLVLNAIAIAAGSRGFSVASRDEVGRLALVGHNAEVHLRISEVLETRLRKPVQAWERSSYKAPTGSLRIKLSFGYGEGPHFEDQATGKLETRLNELFQSIYRLVVRVWRHDREVAARHREFEEGEKRRKVEKRAREARRQEAERERDRRTRLMREVSRWRKAQEHSCLCKTD